MGDDSNLDLLRFVGEALYGERWQSPLAGDLGVSDRAVRYWLSEANQCPDDLGIRLLAVVERKKDDLGGLAATVKIRISRADRTRP